MTLHNDITFQLNSDLDVAKVSQGIKLVNPCYKLVSIVHYAFVFIGILLIKVLFLIQFMEEQSKTTFETT